MSGHHEMPRRGKAKRVGYEIVSGSDSSGDAFVTIPSKAAAAAAVAGHRRSGLQEGVDIRVDEAEAHRREHGDVSNLILVAAGRDRRPARRREEGDEGQEEDEEGGYRYHPLAPLFAAVVLLLLLPTTPPRPRSQNTMQSLSVLHELPSGRAMDAIGAGGLSLIRRRRVHVFHSVLHAGDPIVSVTGTVRYRR